MTLAIGQVEQVDRATVQRWLPALDAWLLPDRFYGAQHTWPQLYRSDGDGMFFAIRESRPDGDRLLSHCAVRIVPVRADGGTFRCALLGSVATDPDLRGQGLASQVLARALAACDERTDVVLLWAERPELYARHGFVTGSDETLLVLARRPRLETPAVVRLAEVKDHDAMAALHDRKPWRVHRSPREMSGLLTTPGMTTVVLEENGVVTAYACCGKGADLQGHWHELGGSDDAVARLLPAAMHVAGQIEAVVLVPPYREGLQAALGACVTAASTVPGPMVRARRPMPPFWIDGLDSV